VKALPVLQKVFHSVTRGSAKGLSLEQRKHKNLCAETCSLSGRGSDEFLPALLMPFTESGVFIYTSSVKDVVNKM